MPNITVKNIPADLYELLKRSAAANRRSVNSEVIWQVERGVRGRKVEPDRAIQRARALRQKSQKHSISDRDFTAAKTAGRR